MDFIISATNLDLPTMAYAFIVLLVAGFVRGYSGFGFSALVITALSIFLLPKAIVPIILCLEILASIHMLPKVWRKTDWKLIAWLMPGAVLATPIGIWILTILPEKPMRITLSLIVLGLCFMLLKGFKISNPAHPATQTSVGFVSGLCNGIAAIGGLPLVLFLIASAAEAAALRATMASYFLTSEFIALGAAYASGLLNIEVFWRLALFIIPMVVGVKLGSRHFFNANPESFKRFSLSLLIVIATSGLIKAVLN